MATTPENRLAQLGYVLPPAWKVPPGIEHPLSPVRVVGKRLLISGHGPQSSTGRFAEPLGQVGRDLSAAQAQQAAHLTALSMIGTLKRELGELSRITAWIRVFGMVKSAPDFTGHMPVINGFSNTIIEVFGRDIGLAARSAIGVASLPFGIPVEVEAECEIR